MRDGEQHDAEGCRGDVDEPHHLTGYDVVVVFVSVEETKSVKYGEVAVVLEPPSSELQPIHEDVPTLNVLAQSDVDRLSVAVEQNLPSLVDDVVQFELPGRHRLDRVNVMDDGLVLL